MQYQTLNEDLIAEFPELAEPRNLLYSDWADEKPGQYILFEDIFRLYVSYLLSAEQSFERNTKLQQIFGGQIENLGFISLLEGRSSSWLQLAKPFLGPLAEGALEEFDPTWRQDSATDPSRFDANDLNDVYRVKEVVSSVLRNTNAT